MPPTCVQGSKRRRRIGHRPLGRLRIVSVALLLALALCTAGAASAETGAYVSTSAPQVVPAKARFVSPRGSDANPGTRSRPWRTIGKAMRSLRPGQTAYLRAGEYVERMGGPCNSARNALTWEAVGTRAAPLTLAGYPGEEQRVVVKTLINLRGAWLRVRNLVVGRNAAYSSFDDDCTGSVGIAVYGRHLAVLESEVHDTAMSGIYVNDAADVTIARNVIRDNGSHEDLDHGIYVSSVDGMLIANNVVSRNLAYGIQFYKDRTRRVRVLHNTVVGNGRSGLVLAGDVSGARVANNIFAFNRDYGIREHELRGDDNLAIRNLFFRNAKGAAWLPSDSLGSLAPIVADPAFVAPGDFRLRRGSPAADRAVREYATAFDHDRRRRGGAADLGAYER